MSHRSFWVVLNCVDVLRSSDGKLFMLLYIQTVYMDRIFVCLYCVPGGMGCEQIQVVNLCGFR